MTLISTKKLPLFFAALAIVALAGITKASYTNPTAAYPNGNTDSPVDTSSSVQAKKIGQTTDQSGGLSVNSFLSVGNAQFDQKTTINGEVNVDSTSSTTDTVQVGGDAVVSGNIHAHEHLNSQTLVNSTGTQPLCSDTNGNIILCD